MKTTTVVAAIIALLLFGCAHTRAGDTIQWQPGERLAMACYVADGLSTSYAINNGAHEVGLLQFVGDEWAAVTSVVLSFGLHYIIRTKLRKFPKQYQAKRWYPISGVRCGAAAWNLSVASGESK